MKKIKNKEKLLADKEEEKLIMEHWALWANNRNIEPYDAWKRKKKGLKDIDENFKNTKFI